jgi:hypothetical protein
LSQTKCFCLKKHEWLHFTLGDATFRVKNPLLLSEKRFANPRCAKRLKSKPCLHIMRAFKALRRRKSRDFFKGLCVREALLSRKARPQHSKHSSGCIMEISRKLGGVRVGRLSYFPSAGAAANRFAYHGSIGATKRQRRLLQYSVPMGAHTHCTAAGKKKKNTNSQLALCLIWLLPLSQCASL